MPGPRGSRSPSACGVRRPPHGGRTAAMLGDAFAGLTPKETSHLRDLAQRWLAGLMAVPPERSNTHDPPHRGRAGRRPRRHPPDRLRRAVADRDGRRASRTAPRSRRRPDRPRGERARLVGARLAGVRGRFRRRRRRHRSPRLVGPSADLRASRRLPRRVHARASSRLSRDRRERGDPRRRRLGEETRAPFGRGGLDDRRRGPTARIGGASRGRSLRARFDRIVAAEFAAQPLQPADAPVTAADLARLPDPVAATWSGLGPSGDLALRTCTWCSTRTCIASQGRRPCGRGRCSTASSAGPPASS